MNPLSYKEAFDPYHTIFRLFRLKFLLPVESNLHFDHVRILDFFLANPFRLKIMSFRTEHRAYRKVATKYSKLSPYSHLPNDFILFAYMRASQVSAVSSLVKSEFLNETKFNEDIIKFSKLEIPHNLLEQVKFSNQQEDDLCSVVSLLASEYNLLGPDGLKKRTGLLEHRNDFIQTNDYR